MKVLLLILLCSVFVFADGVNKRKPKPKPKAHQSQPIKVETPKPKPPKPPELLTTKYDELLGYPFLRTLQPLNDIPPLKPELITNVEVAEYPFEEPAKKRLWIILIGTAAIPFLIPNDDDTPPPITFSPSPEIAPFINPTTAPSPSPGLSPSPSPGGIPGTTGVTEVPEPTSVVLFVTGMAVLFRRKVKAAAHRVRKKS